MTEIRYQYEPQDVDFRGTAYFLYARHSPWSNHWAIIFYLTLAILAFSVFQMFQLDSDGARLLFPWVLMGSVYVAYALMHTRSDKIFIQAVEQSPWHQGTTKITLSQNGMRIIKDSAELTVKWGAVTDVLANLPDKTLILMSPSDYVPCPDAALPDGLTRADLLEQIAKWREI